MNTKGVNNMMRAEPKQSPRNRLRSVASAVAFLSTSIAANSANVTQSDLVALRVEARQAGAAPVLVHLHATTLQQLRTSLPTVRAIADWKVGRLLAELGASALKNGRSDSGTGQLTLYVTEQGLDILRGSANAVAFFPTTAWSQRSALSSTDGAHIAIEASLRQHGFADLEVVANADGLEIRQGFDGSLDFRIGPAAAQDAMSKLIAIVGRADHDEFINKASLLAPATTSGSIASLGTSPMVTMRVSREGLLRLADSAAVRGIRPVGFVDRRAPFIDPEATEEAAKYGEASVTIATRDVHSGGKLTPASIDSLRRGNRALLDELLQHVRPTAIRRDLSRFGAVSARLSNEELTILVAKRDPRLLAVTLNKPFLTKHLAASGPTQNVAAAWNANPPILANGQNVIVFDSGVQANHPFLRTRVVFQACFGTTGAVQGTNLVSACPGATAASNWDSPAGTPNAAAPALGDAHGTHVSGIIAGDQGAGVPAGLRGNAPAAGIFAVQLFSQIQGTNEIRVGPDDLLAALQLAAQSLPQLTNGNTQPFTINMSLGGGRAFATCNDASLNPYINAVQQLRNAGVPIVLSTGNDGFTDSISFPACLPGVVKVSAVANDGVGNTRAVFNATQAANVASPAFFPGERFCLAPGGGNGTFVRSSVTGPLVFNGFQGTSQAAPQITGLYALAKGVVPSWTVQQVGDWFFTNAAVAVPITVTSGGAQQQVNWFRVRLPAL